MRRFLLATACLPLLSAAAMADDFALPAPVTAATVFVQGARLTRTATVDLPAGSHRLLVPATPGAAGVPRVTVAGATLAGARTLTDGAVDAGAYATPAQQAALGAVEAAQAELDRAQDARLAAGAAAQAAEARLAFFRSVSGAALAGLDAGAIAAAAQAVADGVAAALDAVAAAQDAVRRAEVPVEEARLRLAQAERDLQGSGAPMGAVTLLAVDVVSDGGPATLTLEDFAFDAGWQPAYDARLDGAALTLDRKVQVRQATGLAMQGVTLRLSTADPFAQTAPTPAMPDQVRTRPPMPEPRPLARADLKADADTLEMALGAPAVLAAVADTDGPVVEYDFPAVVDLPPDGGAVTLTLDSLTLDARAFNRAAPRHDSTAFRMAALTNTTAEPLLAGPVSLFRDGAAVGEGYLPLVPAGDEAELAFGPIPHLPLEFRLLDNETGDRGLFATQGTRQQEMVFRVRNLSDAPETVETLFALPYDEAEAIDVAVTADPAPDARDVDEARGVARWDLAVPAGGEAEVRIAVRIRWPEGEVLEWYP